MKTFSNTLVSLCPRAPLAALGLLASVALVGFASDARADGLATKPAALEASARQSLSAEITKAKADKKDVRDRVRDVNGVKPEHYKNNRNPIPEASRELAALGKDALFPMLEALAFDAPQRGLSEKESQALTIGMLSAVGDLRDARSAPVLRAALEAQSASTPVAMVAATSLGKLCRKAERDYLKSALESGSRRKAAAYGLGECRNQESIETLVSAVHDDDGAVQIEVVKALGTAGSSWAWAARVRGGKATESEALTARNAAAAALLEAFVAHEGVRAEAKKSLLKTESPTLLAAIQDRKSGADSKLAADLAALEKAVQKQEKRAKR
jgi:hypothetical protein